MALTTLTTDVANVSKLDNYPPDDVGMTMSKLKQVFDQGNIDIKTFINSSLIPELNAELLDKLSETTLTAGIETALADAKASGEFDGSEVELQNSGTYIQWRYVGGEAWTDLVSLADITGVTGATGTQGVQGETGAIGSTGNGIVSVVRTSGTGSSGTTDIYTITFTDSTTTTFNVYNGSDGDGAGDMLVNVYDPNGKLTDAFSMSNMLEGTTNKIFTSAERTKLVGIATGATANSTDAALLNRASHTGTQLKSTISDFPSTMPPSSHTHGSLTNTGAIGSTANLPVFTGTNGVLITKAASEARISIGAAAKFSGSATLAVASWTGSAAPYTYALSVSDILATDTPHVDRVTGTDAAAAKLINTAWNLITGYAVKPQTSAGTITFYADAKPSVAIPIMWEVLRS